MVQIQCAFSRNSCFIETGSHYVVGWTGSHCSRQASWFLGLQACTAIIPFLFVLFFDTESLYIAKLPGLALNLQPPCPRPQAVPACATTLGFQHLGVRFTPSLPYTRHPVRGQKYEFFSHSLWWFCPFPSFTGISTSFQNQSTWTQVTWCVRYTCLQCGSDIKTWLSGGSEVAIKESPCLAAMIIQKTC